MGIKSDHVRLVGRNSVKICAGGARADNFGFKGELDSNGKRLIDSRIELIANRNAEVQPMVLGSNLSDFLEDLLDRIGSIQEAILLQNKNMITLKTALASHFHTGGGVGVIVTGPDPILATVALSQVATDVQKISVECASHEKGTVGRLPFCLLAFSQTARKCRKKKRYA